MTPYEIIFAGFGGQGILFMGQLLAYAATQDGKQVSWLPSYGPEMRGGTANCMVVVSDQQVYSPLVLNPTALVAMNKPSLDRFEPAVKEKGLLVYNMDMIDRPPVRGDLGTLAIPADTVANKLDNPKSMNMVALGAFISASGLVSLDGALECLEKITPPHRKGTLAVNRAALEQGYALGAEGGVKK